MKTLELIVCILIVGGFVGFIAWSTIQIFKHEGPDESHAHTRYENTSVLDNNNKKLRA